MPNTDLRNLRFKGGRILPVGVFYCIGRNYADHAKEMGASIPESPIVFIKPPSAYRPSGSVITLPKFSAEIQHEAEIVAVIGSDCSNLDCNEALGAIAGYAAGIDLTARDIQKQAKERGEPWAISKSFRGSAPMSEVIPAEEFGTQEPRITFSLDINGDLRQKGDTKNMERSFSTLVSYLSQIFDLRAGDCVFSGAPAGVGPVKAGDSARLIMDDRAELTVKFT